MKIATRKEARDCIGCRKTFTPPPSRPYVGRCASCRNKRRDPQKARAWRSRRYRERMETDLQYKLKSYLRRRILISLKKGVRVGSAVRDLGCTFPELHTHLSNLFRPGMSWDNYGEWHIDHRCPLASFDLSNRAQFLEAVHYTNLQPLWAADNIAKGARR